MTANPVTRLLTAEEFFELSEPDDGGKMELRDGMVCTQMPVSGVHGDLQLAIGSALRQFCMSKKLGAAFVEAGFILRRDPDHVLAPDVSFLANERVPDGGITDRGFIAAAPTLAVEVVSPNDRDAEVHRKVVDYIAAGVMRTWVVRPDDATITIHYPDGTTRSLTSGGTLTSDDAGFPVEGFALPLADLFE